MKVVEDLLSKKDLNRVQQALLGPDFAWFYNPFVVDQLKPSAADSSDKFQFTHTFYKTNRPMSPFYDEWYDILFYPIIGEGVLDRIKANLNVRTLEIIENKFHTDIAPATKPLTTSIFYVNTNNGYTKFEDGTIVESVENRLVTFPVKMKHSGTTCTNKNVRIVINFLYMNYE